MPDYQNGKIYKITGGGKTYIGSTTISLSQRIAGHRNDYKKFKGGKKRYISSFQLLDVPDVDISLVENCPCNSKEELHARERYYIENMECVNKVIPLRTSKEYRETHKEHLQEYSKNYNKVYRQENIENIKEYNENNKDKKKEYNRMYSQLHRENINEQRRQRYEKKTTK